MIGSLSPFGARENKENWNLNLYHGGSNITEAEKVEGRRICYECLLRQIMSVKGASSNVGSAIIAPGDEVGAICLLNVCMILYCCILQIFFKYVLFFIILCIITFKFIV